MLILSLDALHANLHLDDGHEAQDQIAFADVLLLNKVDLVNEENLRMLENRLRTMNPAAKLYRTQQSHIELANVLGINAFDVEKNLELDPRFLEEAPHVHHHHDDDVIALVFRESKPLDLEKVEQFLKIWITDQRADTFRYKGVLYINKVKQRVVFQGIRMLFASTAGREWKSNEIKQSEFVIIGRHLDEDWFRQQFANCVVEI